MLRLIIFSFLSFTGFSLLAQQQVANYQDIASIKQLCGCFEVDFKYTETFSDNKDYSFREPYRASALEWVIPIEEAEDKLVLQHILIINDTFFLKHWRQDWTWEADHSFAYEGANRWSKVSLEEQGSSGQWLQEVFEVDDTPRYAGVGQWVTVDGLPVWENTSNAPLPRREYTKRSDYQIMRRTNGHIIHPWGWVHEQDNLKLALQDGEEVVIVEEKGRNTYRRTDLNRCSMAADWWNKQNDFWKSVRDVWGALIESNTGFQLNIPDGDPALRKAISKLQTQAFEDELAAQSAIRETISKFLQKAR